MTIVEKFKKIPYVATLAAALACGNATGAKASGSAELVTGNSNTTLDVKLSGNIAPRTNFFFRNRTSVDHHNQANPFSLVDLSYNVAGGLDAVGEVQLAPNMGAVLRPGLQYFKKFGDFSTYFLATRSIQKYPDVEIITLLKYMPKISKNINLLTQVEALTNFGDSGHNFSTERLRLGLDIKGYRFGVAGDLTQTGKNGKFSYNVGPFFAKNF